ncbi:hypothetical protein TrRE_jg11189 [Triparma retinervis]|uniref:Uncharacterized protein n=1 Tax=Triparma retinervis TaxID=2557542 RepID=A0A9W6ZXS4_9STRA|nr:hypothetical protein TrRE_jg11189 [Triparma retinervis]
MAHPEEHREAQLSSPKIAELSQRASSRKGQEALKALREKYKRSEYNFKVRGKEYEFAETSLQCFSSKNPVRLFFVHLMLHWSFDYIILLAIGINSILLAITDFSVIRLDVPESDPGYGLPDTRSEMSSRNFLQESLDKVFSIIFLVECIVKLVALGFITHEKSYLRDSWNVLDFIIVLTSTVALLPFGGSLNVSAIRTFRVLRPLKTLSALPGLQLIVKSLLASIPALSSVIVLIMFVFTIFGILGNQLFVGVTHNRCRLTPYPVTLDYRLDVHGMLPLNGSSFQCVQDFAGKKGRSTNFDEIDGDIDKEDSPWYDGRDCYWPLAEDMRTCTLEGGSGAHVCVNGPEATAANISESYWSWCGSNYDAWGNMRFNGMINVTMPAGIPNAEGTEEVDEESWVSFMGKNAFVQMPTFNGDKNFGMTTFDDFPRAFVSIFQSITMEGWVDIMYILSDAKGKLLASVFFGILIIFGSFFVLNLLLAVLEENYATGKEEQEAEKKEKAEDDESDDDESSVVKKEKHAGDGEDEEYPTFIEPLKNIADNNTFQIFVTAMIVVNTVVLACETYPMPTSRDSTLELINFVLTLVFAVEMVVKLGGYGPRGYLSDQMNVFDGLIVFISLVELIVMPPDFLSSTTSSSAVDIGGISALRSFRLFRIFKLAREWVSMRIILAKIILTAIEISNFSVLLALFMYIYSLMGMQFFANKLKFDDDSNPIPIGSPHPQTGEDWLSIEPERHNFDDFHNAFVTIFQILSGENWNAVMYDGWRATSGLAVIYFISLIVFGMFIVMTLFLAILLNNFGTDDEEEEEEEQLDEEGQKALEQALTETARREKKKGSPAAHTLPKKKSKIKNANVEPSYYPIEGSSLMIFGPENLLRTKVTAAVAHPYFDQVVLVLIIISSITLAIDDPLGDPNGSQATVLKALDLLFTVLFILEMALKIISMGFVFQPRSYLRDGWNILDFVVVCISILLLFSSGNASLAGLRSLRAFRAFRPLRMINRAPGLKLIVNAMFASIPDVCNVGAVCILFFLIFSIVGVTLLKGQLRSCQGEHFRANIEGHAFVFPDQFSGYLHSPYLWTEDDKNLTAYFGVNSTLFPSGVVPECTTGGACCVPASAQQGGKYDGQVFGSPDEELESWHRVPPSKWSTEVPSSMDVCECLGGTWDIVGCDDDGCLNQIFDHVGTSMLAFFEISSTEGWVDLMYAAQDSRGIGMQPERDANKYISVFFVIFMLIGCYLVMNLFVGVIIDHFNEMRKEAEGDLTYLTEEQQAWVKTQQIAIRMKPKKKIFKPGDPFGDFCHGIVLHKTFESFIMTAIVLNTVIMMLSSFGDSTSWKTFLEGANLFFAVLFTIEMVMKLAAMHYLYFDDSWNRFDFTIVMGTLIGFVAKAASSGGGGASSITTVIRTFRIGRIFRLVNGAESLNQLFNTLLLTIPGLVNIGMLLMLLYFIFSVMAVQLFATVGFNNNYNEDANFRDFWTAFMTLLRFSTGENWNGFMHDLKNGPGEGCKTGEEIVYDETVCGFASRDLPTCNAAFYGTEISTDVGGCGNPVAVVYLVIFQLLVGYVFLNLFIGIILEGFDTADETKRSIKPEDFEKFSNHWAEFDPTATFYISISKLNEFVQTLYAPWGFGDYVATDQEIRAKISELDLKTTKDGRVHFKDVLMGLSKEAVKTEFLIQKMVEHNIELDVIHRAKAPMFHKIERVTAEPGADFRIGHHYAAER